MGRLTTFTFITLDGYFEGPGKGDISWHKHDREEGVFAVDMLQSGNVLLFGRITYEQMAGYWPTPQALLHNRELAEGMNHAPKIVFSESLQQAAWNNTELLKGDLVATIGERKKASRKNMTLLGSGSILTQLAEANLVDEYQIMIDPVAIGQGSAIFQGLQHQLDLELTHSQVFKSGVILLCYKPFNN